MHIEGCSMHTENGRVPGTALIHVLNQAVAWCMYQQNTHALAGYRCTHTLVLHTDLCTVFECVCWAASTHCLQTWLAHWPIHWHRRCPPSPHRWALIAACPEVSCACCSSSLEGCPVSCKRNFQSGGLTLMGAACQRQAMSC